MKVLVTGAGGLVGSAAVKYYSAKGDIVYAVDNDTRGQLWVDGSVQRNIEAIQALPNVIFAPVDIHSQPMVVMIKECDVLIHCAAQPSHPRSVSIPYKDFEINVIGTVFLLESVRAHNRDMRFVFCSTNKVYGENPNTIYPIEELETRYDYAERQTIVGPPPPGLEAGGPMLGMRRPSIDEFCPLDGTHHTPFGASKVAADIYVQEYYHTYGIPTACFRMGCITGPMAKAVEEHNWIPYFFRKNLAKQVLSIFGYKGKQVRDIIHADDLVRAFDAWLDNPRGGEYYNMGGGRENSTSLLEALERIEALTSKPTDWELEPKRTGDHQVYISNLSKFKEHYPEWDIQIGLDEIFEQVYEGVRDGNQHTAQAL
jgi:CDP-paratose 2-epimerase